MLDSGSVNVSAIRPLGSNHVSHGNFTCSSCSFVYCLHICVCEYILHTEIYSYIKKKHSNVKRVAFCI